MAACFLLKLDDRSTKDFQRASNHCNIELQKQMLEKRKSHRNSCGPVQAKHEPLELMACKRQLDPNKS